MSSDSQAPGGQAPSNERPAEQARAPKKSKSIPEELFDRTVTYLDGPVNARAERLMKSRVVLAPIGLSLTVGSRMVLALRERSVRSLWRRID